MKTNLHLNRNLGQLLLLSLFSSVVCKSIKCFHRLVWFFPSAEIFLQHTFASFVRFGEPLKNTYSFAIELKLDLH